MKYLAAIERINGEGRPKGLVNGLGSECGMHVL